MFNLKSKNKKNKKTEEEIKKVNPSVKKEAHEVVRDFSKYFFFLTIIIVFMYYLFVGISYFFEKKEILKEKDKLILDISTLSNMKNNLNKLTDSEKNKISAEFNALKFNKKYLKFDINNVIVLQKVGKKGLGFVLYEVDIFFYTPTEMDLRRFLALQYMNPSLYKLVELKKNKTNFKLKIIYKEIRGEV